MIILASLLKKVLQFINRCSFNDHSVACHLYTRSWIPVMYPRKLSLCLQPSLFFRIFTLYLFSVFSLSVFKHDSNISLLKIKQVHPP